MTFQSEKDFLNSILPQNKRCGITENRLKIRFLPNALQWFESMNVQFSPRDTHIELTHIFVAFQMQLYRLNPMNQVDKKNRVSHEQIQICCGAVLRKRATTRPFQERPIVTNMVVKNIYLFLELEPTQRSQSPDPGRVC